MNFNKKKPLLQCAVWSVAWTAAAAALGMVVSHFTGYTFRDVLFIEGMALVVLGVLFLMGGIPSGISLKALGEKNAQYVASVSAQISLAERRERGNKSFAGLGTSSMLIGGAICLAVDLILCAI